MSSRHLGAAALVLCTALAGCSDASADGPAEAAPPPTPAAASPTPSPQGSPTPSPSAPPATDSGGDDPGCAPAGDGVPTGAGSAPTVDVDGDGEADTLWLADLDGDRTLGVTTASGSTFSAEFSSAAPQPATAVAQRLGDGTVVVLLDLGRSAPLYSVDDCSLRPVENDQGAQYTFDRGFTGYGTGAGCVDLGAGLQLVGLNAVPADDGSSVTVTRTPIELSADGRTGGNGDPTTVVRDASPDDPAVTTAHEITCGDAVDQPVEPTS